LLLEWRTRKRNRIHDRRGLPRGVHLMEREAVGGLDLEIQCHDVGVRGGGGGAQPEGRLKLRDLGEGSAELLPEVAAHRPRIMVVVADDGVFL